jgi:hypothetical protein
MRRRAGSDSKPSRIQLELLRVPRLSRAEVNAHSWSLNMPSAAAQMQSGRAVTGVVVFGWILRLTAAGILLQTLFFKFTAAPESVYIFTRVGAEPWGRISSGVVELIATVLLLIPATTWLGAAIAAGVMLGAVGSHLTVLGIEVQGDDGLLFGLALTVLAASTALLYLERARLPFIGRRLQ